MQYIQAKVNLKKKKKLFVSIVQHVTNSMEHRLAWEANSQEVTRILYKPKVP